MDNKKKKIIIGIAAALLVIGIGSGIYMANKMSSIKKTEVKEENLQVSEEVEEELGDTYLNIALFGVNSKSSKDETMDSDAVYVASLNENTREMKLMAVYGNAMMKYKGEEIRMKDTYAQGGAEQAIAVLNESLNLNIKKYMTVNFKAMVDMINCLDGIEIDVTKEEIPHINGYAKGIAKLLDIETKTVKKAGKQKLDGVQAAGYCRIRITDGGDVKRSSRQKEVISKMFEKLGKAEAAQIDKIMDKVFPEIETNFETSELIDYGKEPASYTLTLVSPFPREIEDQKRKEDKKDKKDKKEEQLADYEEKVVAKDFDKDVAAVHADLFPEQAQQVSEEPASGKQEESKADDSKAEDTDTKQDSKK